LQAPPVFRQRLAIFRPEGKAFVFSGDAAKDKEAMKSFVKAYSQMNRWSQRKSGDAILYVGSDKA
jgi:hypothetical protein